MKLRLLIVFFCTAASVLLLQSAFDQSDHRKSEHAVRAYPVGADTLGAFVERRSPGGGWSSEVTNGCRGLVRVSYATDKVLYQFDCDLSTQQIYPGNELGKIAFGQLAASATITDGGTKD